MNRFPSQISRAAVFVAVAISAAALWWLKAEHYPTEPVRLAQAFIGHLAARQFIQAYELTVKSGHVGATAAQLEEISHREACKVERMVATSPFQSNGNRIRRWASGQEVEMPEVQVEFEGACLLRVTVRRTQGNEWRVFTFASHAG